MTAAPLPVLQGLILQKARRWIRTLNRRRLPCPARRHRLEGLAGPGKRSGHRCGGLVAAHAVRSLEDIRVSDLMNVLGDLKAS
jgi:hypothetical protein